jgi:hypothetical protein
VPNYGRRKTENNLEKGFIFNFNSKGLINLWGPAQAIKQQTSQAFAIPFVKTHKQTLY